MLCEVIVAQRDGSLKWVEISHFQRLFVRDHGALGDRLALWVFERHSLYENNPWTAYHEAEPASLVV